MKIFKMINLILTVIIFMVAVFMQETTNYTNELLQGYDAYNFQFLVGNTTKENLDILETASSDIVYRAGVFEGEDFYSNYYSSSVTTCSDNYDLKTIGLISITEKIKLCPLSHVAEESLLFSDPIIYIDNTSSTTVKSDVTMFEKNQIIVKAEPVYNVYQKKFLVVYFLYAIPFLLIIMFINIFQRIKDSSKISIMKLNGNNPFDIIMQSVTRYKYKYAIIGVLSLLSMLLFVFFFGNVYCLKFGFSILLILLLIMMFFEIVVDYWIVSIIFKKSNMVHSIKKKTNDKVLLKVIKIFFFIFLCIFSFYMYLFVTKSFNSFSLVEESQKFSEVGESMYIPKNGAGNYVEGVDVGGKFDYFYDKYDEKLNGNLVVTGPFYTYDCPNIARDSIEYQDVCAIKINKNYVDSLNVIDSIDPEKFYIFTTDPNTIDVERIYESVNFSEIEYKRENIEVVKLPNGYKQYTYNPIDASFYGESQYIENPILILSDWTKYGDLESMIGNAGGNYFLFAEKNEIRLALDDSNLVEVGEIFYKKSQLREMFTSVKLDLTNKIIQVIFLSITMVLIINVLSFLFVESNKKKLALQKIYGYSLYEMLYKFVRQLFVGGIVASLVFGLIDVQMAIWVFAINLVAITIIITLCNIYIRDNLIQNIKGA